MSINLAPKEILEQNPFWIKAFKWSTTIGRLIIVGTQVIVLGAFFMRFALDRQILDYSEKIKTKQAILKATGNLEEDFRKTQDKLSTIKKLKTSQNQYSQVLEALTHKVPETVTLTNLQLRQNGLIVDAHTPQGDNFAQFLIQLFAWETTQTIVLKNAHFSDTGGLDFQLDITINSQSYQYSTNSS